MPIRDYFDRAVAWAHGLIARVVAYIRGFRSEIISDLGGPGALHFTGGPTSAADSASMLAAHDKVLAAGQLTVEFGGQSVTYKSSVELLKARAEIAGD